MTSTLRVAPIGRKPSGSEFSPAVAPETGAEVQPAHRGAFNGYFQIDDLAERLLAQPQRIADAQHDFDITDRMYQARLTELTIAAFSKPLFPGKKPEDPLRPASNDTEREAAINQMLSNDLGMIDLARQRDTALRTLIRERNEFEALKLVAQLRISAGK